VIRLVKQLSPKQLEWRNDPETMQFTRQSVFISEGEQEKWLKGLDGDQARQFFGIEVSDDPPLLNIGGKIFKKKPEIVGTIGLTSVSMIHRTGEWSLLVGPEYRGRGYARESLKLLLEYGFTHLGLNRIWGEIFETNEASLKLANHFGFKEEGRLRQTYFKNGKYIDSIIVGLLREEWNTRL